MAMVEKKQALVTTDFILLVRVQTGAIAVKISVDFLKTLKLETPLNPAMPSKYLPDRVKRSHYKDAHTPMFAAAQFTIATC